MRARNNARLAFVAFVTVLAACGCSPFGHTLGVDDVIDSEDECDKQGGMACVPEEPVDPCEKDSVECPPDDSFVVTSRVSGGGKRLNAAFGGMVEFDENTGDVRGQYQVVLRSDVPVGTVLSAACEYDTFSDWERVMPNQIEFVGEGTCRILRLDGAREDIVVANFFAFLDDPLGDGVDAIDVDLVGSTGIMVSGGFVEFGDFLFEDF